jgi:hypothetical protein
MRREIVNILAFIGELCLNRWAMQVEIKRCLV